MVQERNIAALKEILAENRDKTVVIGTHGTALASIINYFRPDFGYEDFMRIINRMPYILEMNFDGEKLTEITEHCYIEK